MQNNYEEGHIVHSRHRDEANYEHCEIQTGHHKYSGNSLQRNLTVVEHS